MDKMREKFEENLWNHGLPTYMIATKEALFAKKSSGEYRIPYVQGAWWAYEFLDNAGVKYK